MYCYLRSYSKLNFAVENSVIVGKCLNLLDFGFGMPLFGRQGYGFVLVDELAAAGAAGWPQVARCWWQFAEIVPGMLARLVNFGCDGTFAGFVDEICRFLDSPNF